MTRHFDNVAAAQFRLERCLYRARAWDIDLVPVCNGLGFEPSGLDIDDRLNRAAVNVAFAKAGDIATRMEN